MMEVPDYYEFLQINPSAEPETIHRVYRFLAARLHPDNQDPGDAAKFFLLKEAYAVLSDPQQRAAVAYAVYSPEILHPVEVGADQEKHLIAWLSKRLGARLRVPTLEAAGLSLMGGRLLPGEGDPASGTEPAPVAQFMYQGAKGQRVTLYVRTEAHGHSETAFRFAREGSVRVFYWIDRNFGYALSSGDFDRAQLLRVADLVYQQLNP